MNGYSMGPDMLKFPMYGITNNTPWNFAGNLNGGQDPMMALLMMKASGGGGGLNSGLMEALLGLSHTPKESTEELNKKTETAQKEAEKAKKELEEKKNVKTNEEKSGENFGAVDIAESAGKGVLNMAADIFTTKDEKGERQVSPGKIALGAGLIVASMCFPVVGTVLLAAGACMSGSQLIKGASKAGEAKTYAEKDAAWQEITGGVVGLGLSFLGYRAAANAKAAKAVGIAEKAEGAIGNLLSAAEKAKISIQNNIVEDAVMTAAREKGLADKPQLLEALITHIRGNKPINPSELTSLGATSEQETAMIQSLTKALQENPLNKISLNAQDVDLIASIERQAEIIKNASGDKKAIDIATKALNKLLKTKTEKGGISPELEAELAKVRQTPKVVKPLKSGTTQIVQDLKGTEKDVLSGLEKLVGKTDKEKSLIREAIALFEKIQQKGVNKDELRTTVNALLKLKGLVKGTLKTNLETAQEMLQPSKLDTVKTFGSSTISGTVKAAKFTKDIVTHPITNAHKSNPLLSLVQHSSSKREENGEHLQAEHFAKLDKGIKKQEETAKKAHSEYRENLEKLSKKLGIDPKDKKDEELKQEIDKAIAKAKEEKEAKEAKAKAAAK